MNDAEISVIYKLDYSQPIKLSDLSYSLLGFDRQFRRHLKRSSEEIADQYVRLFIKEINKGSIEAIIVPLFKNALIFANDTNAFFDFVRNIASMLAYLQAGILTAKQPFVLEKPDVEDAKSLVAPVMKDAHSNLAIMALQGGECCCQLQCQLYRCNKHQRGI